MKTWTLVLVGPKERVIQADKMQHHAGPSSMWGTGDGAGFFKFYIGSELVEAIRDTHVVSISQAEAPA